MVAINSLRSLLAFLLLAGLVTSIPTAGATPFEDGNKLYEQNKYEEALAKYDQAVTDHQWTPNLFHNIANTEYRLKNPGLAILNYERALVLDPAHPEARRNLELVRSQTGAKVFLTPIWDRGLPNWRADIFAIVAAVAAWILVFSLAFLWLRRTRSRTLWWGFAVLGLLVGCYASLALWVDWRRQDLGIVTHSGAVARLAPADRAEVAQALPEGSHVRVLSERGAWVYCTLPGKELGWLPAQSLERVRIREQ